MVNEEHSNSTGIVAVGIQRSAARRRGTAKEPSFVFSWATTEQLASLYNLPEEVIDSLMLGVDEAEGSTDDDVLTNKHMALIYSIITYLHMPPRPSQEQADAIHLSVKTLASLTSDQRHAYPMYTFLSILSAAIHGDTSENDRLNNLLCYLRMRGGRKTPPSTYKIKDIFEDRIKTNDDITRLRQDWEFYTVLGKHHKIFNAGDGSFSARRFVGEISTTTIKLLLAGKHRSGDSDADTLWIGLVRPIAERVVRTPTNHADSKNEDAAQAVIASLLQRPIKHDKLEAATLVSLLAYIKKAAESRYNDYRVEANFDGVISPRHSRRLVEQGINNSEDLQNHSVQRLSLIASDKAEVLGFNELFDALSKYFKLSKRQLKKHIDMLCAAGKIQQIIVGPSKKLSLSDSKILHEHLRKVATPR